MKYNKIRKNGKTFRVKEPRLARLIAVKNTLLIIFKSGTLSENVGKQLTFLQIQSTLRKILQMWLR